MNKRVSWARGLLIDSKHERFDEKEAAQVARLSLFLSSAARSAGRTLFLLEEHLHGAKSK